MSTDNTKQEGAASSRTFQPLIGSDAVKKLIAEGILPEGAVRFVIDSGFPGDVVKVYWQTFADGRFLDVVFTEPGLKLVVNGKATPPPELDEGLLDEARRWYGTLAGSSDSSDRKLAETINALRVTVEMLQKRIRDLS